MNNGMAMPARRLATQRYPGAPAAGAHFHHAVPCTRPRACMAEADLSPLLIYHPQGGLGNCLFGLSSAALLATVLCRRFALAWGHNANRQAGASYSSLFQRAEGLAFVNASEGAALVRALGGSEANCTLQLNVAGWDTRQSLTSPAALLNLTVDGFGGKVKAANCPVLHVRGNMYYAPLLERNAQMARASRWLRARGLSCMSGGGSSGGGGGGGGMPHGDGSSSAGASGGNSRRGSKSKDEPERAEPPFFAGVSRHLFVPHNASTNRVDAAVESNLQPTGVAVIGVHVRSTILLALHKDVQRRNNVSTSASSLNGLLRAYGFIDCIARVRNASTSAGYSSSRVYIAADNPLVRIEAADALGGSWNILPPPTYLFTGREARGRMTTVRGSVSTAGAVDEMMLLTRLDGLIVWDLKDSSYSAVAASWAAHRSRSPMAEAARPWLGVHASSTGCTRIPDAEIDPPAHEKMAGRRDAPGGPGV